MGRRPEFVNPKVIAFNAGRESKSPTFPHSPILLNSSDTCLFTWLRPSFFQYRKERHGSFGLQIRIETFLEYFS